MDRVDCDVVVVGAGPVGLAQAIELGSRGVRVLLTERNQRAGRAPRAKTTNVRTRTHLRRWGIADQLAEASPQGVDYPNDVMFVTRLAGPRLAHFRNAFNSYPDRSELYPEHAQWVPQYVLERVMREHLATLPSVELHFDREFTGAEQDADTVTAGFRDGTGAEHSATCRYLIGADGSRSVVRKLIGAKMEGRYGLSRNYNIVFRAPGLAQAHQHGAAVMYWQVNRGGASLIGPMDRDDVWFFMPTGMKEGETLSDAEAAAAIRRATGIDLPYEVLSTDEWVASHLLADRYRQGRIFLAGDACHLHPPFGGYGMNMGIGDGVDLGWKIAAVLQGWGGRGLLDSYEAERRPVHHAVIVEAVANHAVLGGQLFRVLTVYYVLSWLPQLVADAGFAPAMGSLVSGAANAAGVLGGVGLGALAHRRRVSTLTIPSMFGLAASTAALGLSPPSLPLLAAASAVCGFFLYAGIAGVYALLAQSFAPEARATGSGFVIGVGRGGSALAPYAAGALFAAKLSRAEVSLVFAAMAALAAAVLWLRRPDAP